MPDIIADFHGTLYQDADEGPLWTYVAKQAVKPAQTFWHPLRAIAFLEAKPVLEKLTERYKRGEIGYDEIYKAYNKLVLSRLPLDFVQAAIAKYAAMPETKQKLDHRVLAPIKDASGKKGILSTGTRGFILVCLDGSDYSFLRDYVVANNVVQQGNGTEFRLHIYRNKPQIIEGSFFKALKFDPKKTIYFGDNKDEEPAFKCIAGNGGRIVIPFFALQQFKEYAAGKAPYRDKVFVPGSEQELSKFLKSPK